MKQQTNALGSRLCVLLVLPQVSNGAVVSALSRNGCGGNEGTWTEILSKQNFEWWDDAPGKAVGHILTRAFLVHRPRVLSCHPGHNFTFEYAIAGPSLVQRRCTGRSAACRLPRAPTDQMLPVGERILSLLSKRKLLPRRSIAKPVLQKTLNEGPMNCVVPNGKPVVVVLLQRLGDTNHFHYGTMIGAFNALQLCELAAVEAGMSLSDVDCYPVATHSIIGRGHSKEATQKEEWPQLRSFQKRVFGREFLEPCDAIANQRVLAIAFGDTQNPLNGFPRLSTRNVAKWRDEASEEERAMIVKCTQLTPETMSEFFSPECTKAMGKWRIAHGDSTDLPRFVGMDDLMSTFYKRVVQANDAPDAVGAVKPPLPRRVAILQRTHCPFPKRFHRDNEEWRTVFEDMHTHRCLINIAEIEQGLVAAGFQVEIIDFGDKEWSDYARVVEAMQNISIFVGVEGSGSMHALWMPRNRSGFLQILPRRRMHFGYHDLYTEAWMHYT